MHNDVRPDNILVASAAGESSVWIINFEYSEPRDDEMYEVEREKIIRVIESVKRGEDKY